MIDPTFRNNNKLFVLSFKNGDNSPTRNSSTKYYMLLAKMKDNVLIDNKPFFDQPMKNKNHTKNLLKYPEMVTIQHEAYCIICIIKNIIKLLVLINQDNQIQAFLRKLIS